MSEPKRLRDGMMVNTIADIGKERVRRVIKKIKGEKKANMSLVNAPRDRDLGFRVFKLPESNYKPWKGVEERTAENYSAQMKTYTDALVKE